MVMLKPLDRAAAVLRLTVMAACVATLVSCSGDRGEVGKGKASAEEARQREPTAASCRQLGTVPGPEDLVVEKRRERVLVSSQDRRAEPQPPGGIFAVALEAGSTSGPQPLRLVGRDDCSFHPHGISLVESGADPLLYVINHHDSSDTSPSRSCLPGGERLARHGAGFTSIEIFRVEQNALHFLQRLADPEVLENANDLVALPDGTVYATSPPTGPIDLFRDLLAVDPPWLWRWLSWAAGDEPVSEIVRFECSREEPVPCPGEFRSVARIGKYVNGIEARGQEKGGRTIYVASTLEETLYEFAENESTPRREIEVPGGLDNLSWKDDQARVSLIGAAHPNIRRFLQHVRSPEAPSPTAIWEIAIDAAPLRAEIYGDEGSLISAASTAVCYRGDAVLGQVFESAVLRCADVCGAPPEGQPETKEVDRVEATREEVSR